MAVTARFYVESITRHAYNPDNVEVTLRAAGRGEQNRAWAQATPSGEMKMVVNNPSAASFFAACLGQDLALTFEPVGDRSYRSPHEPEDVGQVSGHAD